MIYKTETEAKAELAMQERESNEKYRLGAGGPEETKDIFACVKCLELQKELDAANNGLKYWENISKENERLRETIKRLEANK